MQALIDTIYAELGGRLFLYVPNHLAKQCDNDDVLSDAARLAFPRVYCELRSCGSCLSCGQWTASVFHAMRAAEIGVRVMGKSLDVSFPDKSVDQAEWQHILDQADSKIRTISQQPKSVQKDNDQQFYSTAAAEFRYFKDGWRVRVAHARATYVESEGIKLLDHTRDFFEVLAGRLSE
jgi:hypothetical protein